jgi:hypothetical protein
MLINLRESSKFSSKLLSGHVKKSQGIGEGRSQAPYRFVTIYLKRDEVWIKKLRSLTSMSLFRFVQIVSIGVSDYSFMMSDKLA